MNRISFLNRGYAFKGLLAVNTGLTQLFRIGDHCYSHWSKSCCDFGIQISKFGRALVLDEFHKFLAFVHHVNTPV